MKISSRYIYYTNIYIFGLTYYYFTFLNVLVWIWCIISVRVIVIIMYECDVVNSAVLSRLSSLAGSLFAFSTFHNIHTCVLYTYNITFSGPVAQYSIYTVAVL